MSAVVSVSVAAEEVSAEVTLRFTASVTDAPVLRAGVFRVCPSRVRVTLSRPLAQAAPWQYVVVVMGRALRADGSLGKHVMRTFIGRADAPGWDMPVWAARFMQRCMPVEPVTEFMSTVECGEVVPIWA